MEWPTALLPGNYPINATDWLEALKYARHAQPILPERTQVPAQDWRSNGTVYNQDTEEITSLSTEHGFIADDVAEVYRWHAMAPEGELEMVAVLRLRDGRWAVLMAGCDMTGWGCSESGRAYVGSSFTEVVRWGLSAEQRRLTGCVLAEVDG